MPLSDADLTAQTDTALYNAVKQGMAAALGILYDRHAGLVYGVALKMLGDPQAAEDLTQDVFVQLAKTDAYNPNRGALRTYLAILTRSRAIDRLRSQQASTRTISRWQAHYGNSELTDRSFMQVEQAEQTETLHQALSYLAEDEQTVLRMIYLEGLSQVEAAERLQIPLGTVKTRSRRGLIKLRQILEELAQ
ncbi:MAG: sigma-70 family RNA polymerase sigma factor [Cyanobacteria bacterium P01_A01_bin.105]